MSLYGQNVFTPTEMPVRPLDSELFHIVGEVPTNIVQPTDKRMLVMCVDQGSFRIRVGPYGNQTIAAFINAAETMTLVDHGFVTGDGPVRLNIDAARLTQNSQGLTPTKPEITLTMTDVFLNTQTVVLGSRTYTFQDTLTDVDGNIHIGATLAETLQTFLEAVNLSGGGIPDYADAMTIHADVVAVSVTATTITFRGDVAGISQNTLTSTETQTNGSFPGATFASGTPGVDVVDVYVIRVDDDTFQVAATKADAIAGTEIAFTTDGTPAEVTLDGMPTLEIPTVTDLTGDNGWYLIPPAAALLVLPGPSVTGVRGYGATDVLTYYWF